MNFKFHRIVLFLPLLFSACQTNSTHNEEDLKDCVDSFATAYFNWQYKKSMPYCTQESERWLRYAASNVLQEDIDLLRAQAEGASHEIKGIDFHDNDSTATAVITVRNFLQMDTIGTAGHMVQEATMQLPLVMRNGKWLVKMEGLPQNEK